MYFCTAPYFKLSGHPASSNVDETHNNVPDSSNGNILIHHPHFSSNMSLQV